MTIIQVTNQSVPAARSARQRCDRCGGPFGLVTHRWWGSKFCKRRCKEVHLREIMLVRQRTIYRWCHLLARISLGRQAIPIIPPSAWNSSWRVRTLVCAILILVFFAQSQSRKPGIAVSPSTFKPRIRWTNVRQSRPTSEEPTRFVVPTSINFTRRYGLAKRYLNAPGAGNRKPSKC